MVFMGHMRHMGLIGHGHFGRHLIPFIASIAFIPSILFTLLSLKIRGAGGQPSIDLRS